MKRQILETLQKFIHWRKLYIIMISSNDSPDNPICSFLHSEHKLDI